MSWFNGVIYGSDASLPNAFVVLSMRRIEQSWAEPISLVNDIVKLKGLVRPPDSFTQDSHC